MDQIEIILRPRPYGFHLITDEIIDAISPLPSNGLLHLFIRHTSAGICINENADPDVLHDLNLYFNRLVPVNLQGIKHVLEGEDDMPAHVKSILCGHELSIPFSNQKLLLGTWQGIYLAEFRYKASPRKIIASIIQ
jgi:secondary thiamine-phosphate synthase enzyme